MTIPSDLGFAFSSPQRKRWESLRIPVAKARRPRRRNPCGSRHHTEVLLPISTPCGVSTKGKLENFNFNLSGSTRLLPTEPGDTTTNFCCQQKKWLR